MTRYAGHRYLDYDDVLRRCRDAAAAMPDWVAYAEVGRSRGGRPIPLLTIGRIDGHQDDRPGFWLDGGTHAAEWTSVMAALFCAERWIEEVGCGEGVDWFSRHTVYVMPCLSPDGYQAMIDGAPFLRSTLRPPPPGLARSGLDPCDIDGDGVVRQMRWRHPAGPFVQDAGAPLLMRPRRLEDDPADAYFVASEGEIVAWDGHRWTTAPREHGLDLNRNFPGHWGPFSMFGMDGGTYPASEPESRAALDAFAARPHIACAVTNHTYTGCILTQPYRANGPVGDADIRLMEALAKQAVEGTGYRVFRTHPEFTYDPDQPIRGVWADTVSTVFGVPGYTLELWNPYGFCGVEVDKPAQMFVSPDPEKLRPLFVRFGDPAYGACSWRPFEHPQLGPVEIGGIDYQRTIRNPPESELPAECERGWQVADRLRRSLPDVHGRLLCTPLGEGTHRLELVLENRGCLSTSGLKHGETVGATPSVSATLELEGPERQHGAETQALHHLDGWGAMQVQGAGHPIYPSLPARGHRVVASWTVRGRGIARARWHAGRGGPGSAEVFV